VMPEQAQEESAPLPIDRFVDESGVLHLTNIPQPR